MLIEIDIILKLTEHASVAYGFRYNVREKKRGAM